MRSARDGYGHLLVRAASVSMHDSIDHNLVHGKANTFHCGLGKSTSPRHFERFAYGVVCTVLGRGQYSSSCLKEGPGVSDGQSLIPCANASHRFVQPATYSDCWNLEVIP